MKRIIPTKLKKGDTVRVITPSSSARIMSQGGKDIALNKFKELGLKVTFGKHIEENDALGSSSIESRISDIHNAFSDKEVKAILPLSGGYNCNELLSYIDWDLIKNNPKIFCGYSDITALHNAIFIKTGLVTYNGPNYITFSQKLYFEYTLDMFKKCVMSNDPYELTSSLNWSEDQWYKDQEKRNLIKNLGYETINDVSVNISGTLLGGNLSTLNLLQGTEYFPNLSDSILFIEDDDLSTPEIINRDLQSLIHQKDFNKVKCIVFGRFEKGSNMSVKLLRKIIKDKKELNSVPIVACADFGHTDPMSTFPIGGKVKINLTGAKPNIIVNLH